MSGTVTTLFAPSHTFLRQSPGFRPSTSAPASRLADMHASFAHSNLRHSVLLPHWSADVQLHLPVTHLRLPPSPQAVPSATGVCTGSPSTHASVVHSLPSFGGRGESLWAHTPLSHSSSVHGLPSSHPLSPNGSSCG